ncbi:interferon gamma receptor 1-like [Cheilinus undulatus]|uniref:interferon gamma receptor 1-like n=1 Tax=Cheilinus undulatus TaxID=241271 RepID=UPI001BD1F836|nr:interferon gamma receptor 1-like [Cheilinus undulatus]
MGRSVRLFYPFLVSFVCFQALAGPVNPPTNVTLQCRNLQNVLKWSFDQPLAPGLKFNISIGCIQKCPTNLLVDPPALQADLSFLSHPNDDYLVSVSALIGEDESEKAPPEGIEFSYFMDSPVPQKCVVDLPSVDVTAQKNDVVLLRFVHPWVFHKQNHKTGIRKKRSHEIEEDLPEFNYDVVIVDQKEQPHGFSCVDSVCEETLPVDAAQEKHCLKITGEMKGMTVKSTKDYCTLPIPADNTYLIYVFVVGAVLLMSLILILIMVFIRKTKPTSFFPGSMNITNRPRNVTMGVVQEQFSEVEPSSPTPLLPTPDMTEVTPMVVSEPEFRLPIGVLSKDKVVCKDAEVPNEEGSEYAQGRNLEDDVLEDNMLDSEEIHSAYERRPVVVDIAPGEQAEGYRA